MLAEDRPALSGFDQDLWSARFRYAEAPLEPSVRLLVTLRESNVALLRDLRPGDLERVGVHEERGPESLVRMIGLYAGHDLVHLRQIDRILAAAATGSA